MKSTISKIFLASLLVFGLHAGHRPTKAEVKCLLAVSLDKSRAWNQMIHQSTRAYRAHGMNEEHPAVKPLMLQTHAACKAWIDATNAFSSAYAALKERK